MAVMAELNKYLKISADSFQRVYENFNSFHSF